MPVSHCVDCDKELVNYRAKRCRSCSHRYFSDRMSAKNEDRFWGHVDKVSSPYECWLWTKGKSTRGYGQVSFHGRHMRANRVAWILTHGDIPDDMIVCHNCPGGDNPSCVNPAHLWLGTHKDNAIDRERKGRSKHKGGGGFGDRNGMRQHPESVLRGERNARAKLTNQQAEAVRARYNPPNNTLKQVAEEFGVSIRTTHRIILGKSYS